MSLFSSKKLDHLIDSHKSKTGRRLTIREVAKETEISPAYLTLLKNGQRNNPSMDVVVKLSQFFKVAPEELLEDNEIKTTDSRTMAEPASDTQMERTLQLCEQMIKTNNSAQAIDLLQLLESSPEAQRPDLQTEIQLTKARALLGLQRLDEANQVVETCLEQPLTTRQRATSLYLLARIHFFRERYTLTLADLLQAKELAEACQDQELLYQIHYSLGITYKETYEYGSSIYHFECAQRMFPSSLPLQQKGHMLMGMGNTYLRLMSVGAAMSAYEGAEAIYRECGDQTLIAAVRHNIARVKMIEGKYEEAIAALQESLKTHQLVGEHIGIAADLLETAHCYKALEQWDKVREFAFRASVTYENGNKLGLAAQAKLLMIEAAVYGQQAGELKAPLDDIIVVFRELEWHLFLAQAYHLKATVLLQAGQSEEALAMSLEALELYGKYAQQPVKGTE
ncbi:MAG: tetratricopeptide repeat protein [Tumebacillaceae bacterium]